MEMSHANFIDEYSNEMFIGGSLCGKQSFWQVALFCFALFCFALLCFALFCFVLLCSALL